MAFRTVTRLVLKETQDTQAPEYLDKRLYDFHFTSAEQIVPETKPATAEQKPAKPTAVAACDGVEALVGSERRCLKPGDDDAFAAGLLVGWTQTGRRPRFEVVTGVSAGALIAPFAFLDPAYDRQLVTMWTSCGAQDLIDKGEPREAHPAYWAPFVVVGEGGAAVK
jgi:hypothetical protein